MGNERHGLACFLALSLLVGHNGRVSAGFIDMDTPLEARTTKKSLVDGSVYDLVRPLSFAVG
jgi:hypothetical protein